MAHRVQHILDAAAAAHIANTNLRATVEVNRTRSLGEDQDEVPALTINYGADSPDDAQDQTDIASGIEIELTAYVAGDSESDVLQALLELRTQSHISLMADMTLGLSFLWELRYGGADKPQVVQAERMLGAQTCRWTARYLMNSDDPQ